MMCSALRASVAGVFPWDGWSSGDNRTDDHLKDLLEILFSARNLLHCNENRLGRRFDRRLSQLGNCLTG